MDERINLVWCFQYSPIYIIQIYASIKSVLINTQSSVRICLIYDQLPQKDIDVLEELKKEYDVIFEFIQLKDEDFKPYWEEILKTEVFYSKGTYYRLLIPLYLKDCKKCIYLDGDTICYNFDIKELWGKELNGNSVGGVSDVKEFFLSVHKRLDFLEVNENEYINAGILLIDIQKWVKKDILLQMKILVDENIEKRKITGEKHSYFGDQDFINKIFQGEKFLLEHKYNCFLTSFQELKFESCLIHYVEFKFNKFTKIYFQQKKYKFLFYFFKKEFIGNSYQKTLFFKGIQTNIILFFYHDLRFFPRQTMKKIVKKDGMLYKMIKKIGF